MGEFSYIDAKEYEKGELVLVRSDVRKAWKEGIVYSIDPFLIQSSKWKGWKIQKPKPYPFVKKKIYENYDYSI